MVMASKGTRERPSCVERRTLSYSGYLMSIPALPNKSYLNGDFHWLGIGMSIIVYGSGSLYLYWIGIRSHVLIKELSSSIW